MKWAKLGKAGSASSDELASYVYYDKETLNRTFGIISSDNGSGKLPQKQSPNLWVRYKFRKSVEKDNQRDYEIFCGGFLHFYDVEVRNKATEHQIYFDWSQKKIDGFFYLSIYIFPKPHPPKSRAFFKANTKMESDAPEKNAASLNNEMVVEFAAIDPPTPPPPPPPPRD